MAAILTTFHKRKLAVNGTVALVALIVAVGSLG